MQTSRSPSRSHSIETAALSFLLLLGCCGSAGAQTVANNTSLSFGSFTAGSGGTVAVSAAGARSKTGGVILSSQGVASASQFTVTGTSSATVTISLPTDGTVLLSDGSHTMALTGFVSNPNATGILSGGGTLTISVGAVLNVGNAQPPGNYTGSFNVTVNY